MLTVPEEFLLLTLKDEGGDFVDIPVESLRAGFVGAALMELALLDRLDCDTTEVWIVDDAPTGNRSLDPVLWRLSTPSFSNRSDSLIEQMIDLGESIREASLKRLCDRGILVETEGRLLWLLRTRRYPMFDGKEVREVKLRLIDVLLRDGLPDPRDVCLMSLAETCGIIGQIVPASETALAQERMTKFSKMELFGQNVRQHLEIFRRSMILAVHSDLF
jgi:Golgi phosphoprotein 3